MRLGSNIKRSARDSMLGEMIGKPLIKNNYFLIRSGFQMPSWSRRYEFRLPSWDQFPLPWDWCSVSSLTFMACFAAPLCKCKVVLQSKPWKVKTSQIPEVFPTCSESFLTYTFWLHWSISLLFFVLFFCNNYFHNTCHHYFMTSAVEMRWNILLINFFPKQTPVQHS